MPQDHDDDVQLTDLEVIAQFSLAVRGATAPRADVIAALEADLAYLTGSRRAARPAERSTGVTTEPEAMDLPRASVADARTPVAKAPATKAPVAKPAVTQAPVSKAPAAKARATKALAKQAPATKAPAAKAPATKALAKQARAAKAPAKKATAKAARTRA